MKIINLRDFYPFYTSDRFINVSNEVQDLLTQSKRNEAAYHSRKYYNKAQYSLDQDDGIEGHILNNVASAEDVYEHKENTKFFLAAISALPDKQARRIYAHYFLEISKSSIAKAEGVSEKAIRASIRRGLKAIENNYKKVSVGGSKMSSKSNDR